MGFRLGEFICSVLINEVSKVVSLLALPLARASLQLFELHLSEALVIAVIPLENILNTGRFLSKVALLTAKVGLELWEILLNQVKLDYVLGLGGFISGS